jgi:hypothetical protein
MDAGAMGRAGVALGAGRTKASDRIDFAVGFSAIRKVGTRSVRVNLFSSSTPAMNRPSTPRDHCSTVPSPSRSCASMRAFLAAFLVWC